MGKITDDREARGEYVVADILEGMAELAKAHLLSLAADLDP